MQRARLLWYTRTLSLLDDDVETLAAWSAIFAADGYDVRTATNGQKALKCFAESQVDVVVTDWRMAVMSGSELYHQLRTAPGLAGAAFIPVSGEPRSPAFVRLDAFLPEPVDGTVLLAAMRRILAQNTGHRSSQLTARVAVFRVFRACRQSDSQGMKN